MVSVLMIHTEAGIDRNWILQYFRQFRKNEDQLLLGVEAELLGVEASTGLAISYEGPRGIEGIFDRLIHRFGWEPIFESDKVIALQRGLAQIHLEPGGQLELSGVPYSNLKENLNELQGYYCELKEASGEAIAWLELGIQPFSPLKSISQVPKARYKILGDYLGRKGASSHRMMKQTATLQANLDYTDEKDAMEKLKVAMGIAPIMVGLFANSPLLEGKSCGMLSLRSHAWLNTDPDRCGLIPAIFVDEPRLEDYIEYLLKVPMIFIVRDEKWIAVHDLTFGEFLDHGDRGFLPTEADWELFLTSVFTEARLNPFVELRSADRNSLDLSLGMLALWKGILFDDGARRAAWQLVRDWTFEERLKFLEDAAVRAFKARVRHHCLKDLAQEMINDAELALKDRFARGLTQEDESIYLESLKVLLEGGLCPAEKLLKHWEGSWNRNPQKLIEYCRI